MAVLSKEVSFDALRGSLLTFERAGDVLPDHVHARATNHITLIVRGSFRCTGNPVIEGRVLAPGALADWPEGVPHGFVALEDDFKNGAAAEGTLKRWQSRISAELARR